MDPTPMYGAGAEKPLQKAYFAMKQTNICRLSGDIIIYTVEQKTNGCIAYSYYYTVSQKTCHQTFVYYFTRY